MSRTRALRTAALAAVLASCLVAPSPARAVPPDRSTPLKIAPDVEARRRQFVAKPLAGDLSQLAPGDRDAVAHLVVAARELHEVFLLQYWRQMPVVARRVAALTGPLAEPAREYFRIMAGPWDRLRGDEPFVGEATRLPGAGFYPEDMAKAEFEGWIAAHPADRAAFLSPTTGIVRGETDGRLKAVPYGQLYRDRLLRVAEELRTASKLTTDKPLAAFLALRADALLSDDYFASDMAWMDLSGAIEVVIGPYETYDDQLFGYKASFESFVCVTQRADSERLAHYKQELPFLEKNLPIPDEFKNLKRGTASPIRVSDVVYASGEARSGVQTIAFNLPNDERVREAKGSKKVLLKNMMQAKYEAILKPLAGRVLPAAEASRLDPDSFFHFILFHEMSHGLGPGRLVKDGRATEVRLELRDLYSAIEEAKADVVGTWDLYTLADRKVVPASVIEPLPWTFVAGLFRTARFGVGEAHGLGVVLQTNWLLENGALALTPEGRFRPVPEKFRQGITALARELLLLEAHADYDAAKAFVARYGRPPAQMVAVIGGLGDIPVDVDPVYTMFAERFGARFEQKR